MGQAPILFRRFVDDAALFPPGNAPMATAVPAHRAVRSGRLDPFVGPFLCPSSRLGELCTHLQDEDRLDLGLIVDDGIDAMAAAVAAARADPRLDLELVEIAAAAGTGVAAGARAAIEQAAEAPELFVELPRQAGWRDALDHVAEAGRGAKLRTGGVRADLFPSDAELAAFIAAAADAGVAFKCTAGLHHAVRHVDTGTGFRHHGFLNVIVATARAVCGGDVGAAIAETDGARLAAEAAGLDDDHAQRTRTGFHSYGSCDLAGPIADLEALGLLWSTDTGSG